MTQSERDKLIFRCEVRGIKYHIDESGQVMLHGSYEHLGEEDPRQTKKEKT